MPAKKTTKAMAAAKPKTAQPSGAKAAGKLSPGDPAPAFTLTDQSGREVRSKDLRGRKVLLYFYPKADTPGCTTQSCGVRDRLRDLRRLGVEALGVSPDATKALARFDEKHSLGFPLLSDQDHATAEAFGAWGEKSMYGRRYMGIVRSSFLIDEKGRVLGAWYGVKPAETVPLALEALEG